MEDLIGLVVVVFIVILSALFKDHTKEPSAMLFSDSDLPDVNLTPSPSQFKSQKQFQRQPQNIQRRVQGKVRHYRFPIVNLFKHQLKEILIVSCTVNLNPENERALFKHLRKLIQNRLLKAYDQIPHTTLNQKMLENVEQSLRVVIRQEIPEIRLDQLILMKTYQSGGISLKNHMFAILLVRDQIRINTKVWVNSEGNLAGYLEQIISTFINFHLNQTLMDQNSDMSEPLLYELFEDILQNDLKPIFDTLGFEITKYQIIQNREGGYMPKEISTTTKANTKSNKSKRYRSRGTIEELAQKGGDRIQKMQTAKKSAKIAITNYAQQSATVFEIPEEEPLQLKTDIPVEKQIIEEEIIEEKIEEKSIQTDSLFSDLSDPAATSSLFDDIPVSSSTEELKPLDSINTLFDDSMDLTVDKLEF